VGVILSRRTNRLLNRKKRLARVIIKIYYLVRIVRKNLKRGQELIVINISKLRKKPVLKKIKTLVILTSQMRQR